MPAGIEARVLGPLQMEVDGCGVTLTGERQRACLAVLLLARGGVVSSEALAQELWGEDRPASERASVQMHVSRLRRALRNGHHDGRLLVRAVNGGYALACPLTVEVDRFEAAVAEARTQAPEVAVRTLGSALAMWRGPAFADAGDGPLIAAERRRLEDARREARLARAHAQTELGRGGDVVADLRALAAEDPLDETVGCALMRALAGAGRTADALTVFHALRRRLVDELGIEPGVELRDLYARLLSREPVVVAATTPAPLPVAPGELAPTRPRHSGRRAIAVAALVLAAAAVAVAWPRESPPAWPSGGALARFDAGAGELREVVAVGARPVGVAILRGDIWVAVAGENALVRTRGGERERIVLPGSVDGLAAGLGALWVIDGGAGVVRRVDPATGRVAATVRVGNGPVAVAVGTGRVWVLNAGDASLVRVTPEGRVDGRVAVGSLPAAVAVVGGSAWVADASAGTVSAIDVRTLAPGAVVSVGAQPRALAQADGALWSANALDGTLSRIDPRGGRVVSTVPVGRGVAAIAGTGSDLWVADPAHESVTLVDGGTGALLRRIPVRGTVSGLAVAGERAWAATLPPASAHVGGTLVVAGFHRPRTVHPGDPAGDYTFDGDALHAATNDGLLTYRRVAGAPGAAVVPDLATAMPATSHGGRVWTFRLRRGLVYSTGAPVRPSDVRATLLRLYRMHPPALDEYLPLGLAGERACLRRAWARCERTLGVRADDRANTVAMHVEGGGRSLQLALAAPLFSILPAGTPARPLTEPPFPATGPYQVSVAAPGRVVLTRNPRFVAWSEDAQPPGFPDRIVWLDRTAPAEARAAVRDGRADVLFSELDGDAIRDVTTLAPGRTAALPIPPSVEFLGFQTGRGPFSDLRVRRAAALAVTRAELARAIGPPLAMTRACGLLPPGLPGAATARCPEDEGTPAALVRGRRLVAEAGARGRRVTVLVPGAEPGVRRALALLAAGLRAVGLRPRLVTGPADHSRYFARVLGGHTDAFWGHWWAQSPDPDEFLAGLLGCRSMPGAFRPTRWCDPAYDRLVARARAVAPTDAAAAAALWARADRRATAAAPLIPFAHGRLVAAVSPRTGNVLPHPRFGILLAQLWVR